MQWRKNKIKKSFTNGFEPIILKEQFSYSYKILIEIPVENGMIIFELRRDEMIKMEVSYERKI